MQTSAQALTALEVEEGMVLRAYRCPAGVWTIGPGLTAASGVVKPKAGMVITLTEARDMTQSALRRNFEPRVAKAMPGARQHEFDAGVMFDWNTGAIHKASWVQLWAAKAVRLTIWSKFKLWNKGNGKVLPGLVARRQREFVILMDGLYPSHPAVVMPRANAAAVWALPTTLAERARIGAQLHALGYPSYQPGQDGTLADEVTSRAVRAFQADHGLTADGIIGRATLSTLQRRIDAKARTEYVAAANVAAVPVGTTDIADHLAGLPHTGTLLIAGAAIFALHTAWRYRDVIAAKAHRRAPKIATILRSF
jgi:lysozyme